MKSATFAPMPSAITRIAIVANPGVRVSVLVAYLRSRQRLSMIVTVFCCHNVSRTAPGLPNLIRARRRASSSGMPRATFFGDFPRHVAFHLSIQLRVRPPAAKKPVPAHSPPPFATTHYESALLLGKLSAPVHLGALPHAQDSRVMPLPIGGFCQL